jgi:hypothetical protein
VSNLRKDAEKPAVSSAALAREISALVTRSLSGEAIDASAQGEALAAKYPDLGMSGELIGKAIGRAEGMMQTVRSGGSAAAAPDAAHAGDAAAAEVQPAEPVAHDETAPAEKGGGAPAKATDLIDGRASQFAQGVQPGEPAQAAVKRRRPRAPLYGTALAAAARLSEAPLAMVRRAFYRP